jgi:hypothetical protein
VPCIAGCAGQGHAAAKDAPRPAGGYVAGSDLERQLGNAFRKGLYRLAVMSQQTEDAMDLGQPLPTGLLRSVRCDSTAPRPKGGAWTWSCSVSWRSVEGHSERTRYAVELQRGECFAAGATPHRAARYDATIRTYSEDPLNAFGSARRGC